MLREDDIKLVMEAKNDLDAVNALIERIEKHEALMEVSTTVWDNGKAKHIEDAEDLELKIIRVDSQGGLLEKKTHVPSRPALHDAMRPLILRHLREEREDLRRVLQDFGVSLKD